MSYCSRLSLSVAAALVLAVTSSGASAQCPVAKLSAQDGTATERLGWSVDATGEWLFVGDPYTNIVSSDSGAVFVYRRETPDGPWERTQVLTQPTPVGSDQFGFSLAADEGVLVVGAVRQSATGSLSGAAHVYRLQDGTWSHSQQLSPEEPDYKEQFGYSVDVEDGLIVVGAPSNDDNGIRRGAIYVWRDLGFFAAFEDVLYSPTVGGLGELGISVATDGSIVAGGAPFDSVNGAGSAGSVVWFEEVGGLWTEVGRAVAPSSSSDARFGTAIDLSPSHLVVGCPRDDTFGLEEGAVFLFDRSTNPWSQSQTLQPAAAALASTRYFGSAVDATDDAVVVGYREQCCQGDAAGVALWERSGATWSETAQLHPPEGGSDQKSFGFDVAIDDAYILVGAPEDSDPIYRKGAAVVFERAREDCLYAEPANVPVGSGASVRLWTGSNPVNDGDLVFVLGSATSSESTLMVDGVAIPLTLDAYTLLTAVEAGSPTFVGTVSTLDGNGAAEAVITIPAGLPPSLAGVSLYHSTARVAFDGPIPQIEAATNAVAVRLGS